VHKPSVADRDRVSALLRSGPGAVHMIGIAGVGMAGLAYLLQAVGWRVTGCDVAATGSICSWLSTAGINVLVGHSVSHIDENTDFVIRTTAVAASSCEVERAEELEIPVFQRGVVLSALVGQRNSIAVSGTHGKTTTAAMIAQILAASSCQPDFCIGGEVVALGGVAGVGDGSVLVVEADESDGTVSLYSPDIAVITNIEYDHMEHFSDREEVEDCFRSFLAQARKTIVYCADDEGATRICRTHAQAFSYGFSEADYRGTDVMEGAESVTFSVDHGQERLGELTVPVGGRHNALNALGACAVAIECGCKFSDIRRGLQNFVPVRRRFERIGEVKGVTIYSDYAHHPTEIRAVIDTAKRLSYRRLVAIFQPHRFTRTRALGVDFPPAFVGVDEVILCPVYAASEAPLSGGTSRDLLEHFRLDGRIVIRLAESLKDAWAIASELTMAGDVLLLIGAGDVEQIGQWAVAP